MLKTVILCGGKGTRLKPLTELVPKPLVTLNGKPCLQHIIETYVRKGCNHFIVCIGYRGNTVVEFLQHHSFNAKFEFSEAGEEASILERLHHARSLIGERAFVAYGDTLIDVNLKQMHEEHLSSNASITLTTAEVRSPFGLISVNKDRRILSFDEKPLQPYYVGHMLIERSILDEVDGELLGRPDGEGLVLLFQRLIAQRRVKAFPYIGPQITFNTQQDLEQAEHDLVTFFTHVERESH